MKRILYITVDTKPEDKSISSTLGREFVNKLIAKDSEYTLEELNLYKSNIPEMSDLFVNEEVELVRGEVYDKLSTEHKKDVDRIDELCNQFLSGDVYVIAAPMWSLSFPSILKKYIDCIALGNKLIAFPKNSKKPVPLLNDKERVMVYLQTSGGDYPFYMEHKINYGVDYCHDLFKGLGIKKFEKILVEGTIQYKETKDKFMDKAHKDIDKIVKDL